MRACFLKASQRPASTKLTSSFLLLLLLPIHSYYVYTEWLFPASLTRDHTRTPAAQKRCRSSTSSSSGSPATADGTANGTAAPPRAQRRKLHLSLGDDHLDFTPGTPCRVLRASAESGEDVAAHAVVQSVGRNGLRVTVLDAGCFTTHTIARNEIATKVEFFSPSSSSEGAEKAKEAAAAVLNIVAQATEEATLRRSPPGGGRGRGRGSQGGEVPH